MANIERDKREIKEKENKEHRKLAKRYILV